jgi:hypothetical protein
MIHSRLLRKQCAGVVTAVNPIKGRENLKSNISISSKR